MPEVDLPLVVSSGQPALEAAVGQVKAFLVACSVSGLETLVDRDEVTVLTGGNVPRYYCGACKTSHNLHLWPTGKKEAGR